MKKLDVLMAVLVIIGGLNWGIIGLFDFNIVQEIFAKTWIDRVIYVLVGIAAAYQAVGYKGIQQRWKSGK